MTNRLATAATLATLLFAGAWGVQWRRHHLARPDDITRLPDVSTHRGDSGISVQFAVYTPQETAENPVPAKPQSKPRKPPSPKKPADPVRVAKTSPSAPSGFSFPQKRADTPAPAKPPPPKRPAAPVRTIKTSSPAPPGFVFPRERADAPAPKKSPPVSSGSGGIQSDALYEGDDLKIEYPGSCYRKKHVGTIEVKFRIGKDGSASNVTILRGTGCRTLDRAVLTAVDTHEFTPATKNDKPVASTVRWAITCKMPTP